MATLFPKVIQGNIPAILHLNTTRSFSCEHFVRARLRFVRQMREQSAILLLRGKSSALVAEIKEREKTMQTPELWPPSHSEYDQAEEEEKEQEQMQEELPAVLLRAEEEEENRERELKRDFNFPLGGNDLLAYLIIFLLLIVGFVLLVVFHVI